MGNICNTEDRSFAGEEANTGVKAKHTVKAATCIVVETGIGQRINVRSTEHPNLPVCSTGPCGTDTGRSKHRYRVATGCWIDGRATDIWPEISVCLLVESSASSFYNWGMPEAAGFQDILQKYDTLTDFMSSQKSPKLHPYCISSLRICRSSHHWPLLLQFNTPSIMDGHVQKLMLICRRWRWEMEPFTEAGMSWARASGSHTHTHTHMPFNHTLQEAMSLLQGLKEQKKGKE